MARFRAFDNQMFGMRIFDAGAFSCQLRIVAVTDDETAEFNIQGVTRDGRVPFQKLHAATLYGDTLYGSDLTSAELDESFHICALVAD